MADHSTTGDAINHAIDKASDGLTQIAHALSNAAPQAWSLAVHGTFATGLSQVIVGGLLLIPAAVAAFVGNKVLASGLKAFAANQDNFSDAGAARIALGIVILVCALFVFVGASINLCDHDAWARVISPDGYLAQQILSKAL